MNTTRGENEGVRGGGVCDWFVSPATGIHPDTHSEEMFSWFPIFFPLKVSIDGECIA